MAKTETPSRRREGCRTIRASIAAGRRGSLSPLKRGAQNVSAVPIDASTQKTASTIVNWNRVRSNPRRVR